MRHGHCERSAKVVGVPCPREYPSRPATTSFLDTLSGRQAARVVDKIFTGVKPAEIPVEVNSKVELVINLQVAKALGLTIAREVLYQADRLIR
jgi:ABC-type uncharacterized transport system substrate-binding protein